MKNLNKSQISQEMTQKQETVVKVIGFIDLSQFEKEVNISDSVEEEPIEFNEFYQPGQRYPDEDFSDVDEDSSAYLFERPGRR